MQNIFEKIRNRVYRLTPPRGVEHLLENLPGFQSELEALPEKIRGVAAQRMLFSLANLILKDPKFRSQLFKDGEGFGVHILPTHFYSPLPTTSEIPDKVFELDVQNSPALDLGIEKQKAHFREIGKFSNELSDVQFEAEPEVYSWRNSAFGPIDATVYYGMVRSLKPKRVIEIGSGYSTMIATRAADFNGTTSIKCIEPYPMASLLANKKIELVAKLIQDVDLTVFDELGENDILFIDSTHVSRAGSDVNHIFSRILPRLKPGVVVHFHDIFLPFEYPKYWVKDEHIFWNEQYMLQNFLAYNSEFETMATNFFWLKTDPAFLLECFPVLNQKHIDLKGAGSYWIRRRTNTGSPHPASR